MASMNKGRAAAQASHASNAFIHRNKHRNAVKQWQQQTKQGFGTAIVLGIKAQEWFDVEDKLDTYNCPSELVVDPEYCFTVTSEVAYLLKRTGGIKWVKDLGDGNVILQRGDWCCGYIFGDKKELEPILGHLPLFS
jgi:hypothetical protein